jgi:hypothetical protein
MFASESPYGWALLWSFCRREKLALEFGSKKGISEGDRQGAAITKALEKAGVEFTNGKRRGVRLVGRLGRAGIDLGENGSVVPRPKGKPR